MLGLATQPTPLPGSHGPPWEPIPSFESSTSYPSSVCVPTQERGNEEPPLKAAVLGAANGKNRPCVTSDIKIAYPIIFFERP
jgi:hypothetical protein